MQLILFYITMVFSIIGFSLPVAKAIDLNTNGAAIFLLEMEPPSNLTCGDVYLDSGGTAGSYATNELDTVIICPATPGDAVTLTFTLVDIETAGTNGNQDGCWDFLSIHNGNSTASPALAATLCGEGDGDGDQPAVASSLLEAGDEFSSTDASGCLTVTFSSDGSVVEAGWAADVTCAPLPTCFPPLDLAATNITANSADLSWTDNNGAALWDIELVNLSDGGTAMGIPTSTGVGNPLNLTGLAPQTLYDYYVRADCGAGDLSEWEGPFSFMTDCGIQTAPYAENFDNGGLVPDCWMTFGDELWLFADGSAAEPNHGGNTGDIVDHTSGTGYFAWVNDSSPESVETTLQSPLVDIAALTDPALIFWINSDNEGNSNVSFTIDFYDGAAWNPAIYFSNANTNGWLKVVVPLSGYTISGAVQARFIVDEINATDFYDDFAIDDISFDEAPACINPSNLAVANITDNSAEISWMANGAEPGWDYELVDLTAGNSQTMNPTASTGNNPLLLTGLASNNDYEIYIRANCDLNGFSDWVGPLAFSTLCAPFVAPYLEDFDNGGLIPTCWENLGTESWFFADGTASEPGHGGNAGNIVDHTSGTGYFAWVNDSSPESTGTSLQTPLVDITSLTNPGLIFWINSDNEGVTNVDFSVDFYDGTNWNVAVFTNNTNTDGWLQIFVPLTGFTITGPVRARFVVDENNGTDFYDDIALDDVSFEDLPSCLPPTMLAASNITPNAADISWTPGSMETSWDYELVDLSAGGTQTMNPTMSGVASPFTINNLAELNDYAVYVRADCGAGDFSTWVGPLAFSTGYTTPPACDGLFLDNGGTSAYANNSQDTVIICPDNAGDAVTLTFTFVDLESSTATGQQDGCWDFLTIYNGNSTASPVLAATLCGELDGDGGIPSDPNSLLQAGDSFTSLDASGCLTVVFNSDGSGQEEGFIAEVGCMLPPVCPAPTNLATTNITANTADFSWLENGAATVWDIELVDITLGGSAVGSPTSASVGNPFNQNGLLSNNAYEYYVRANCGGGDYSDWTGPFPFMTACDPVLGDSIQTPILASLPYSTVGNNATCYTDQYTGSTGLDVFYQFTTGNCTGKVTLSTCTDTTNFDTRLYLLDTNGVLVASNDDAANGTCSFLLNGLNRFSIIESVVQANTTYYAVVEGFALGDAGTYGLEITEEVALDASVGTVTAVSCNGDSDGTITAAVSGGTAPYTYQWNNGGNTQTISNLAPGTYSAFVTDNNGCGTVLTGIVVAEPDPISITLNAISNVRCNGNSDGFILVTPAGGTPPYSYMWSNGAITEDNIGIPIGLYSLTITDGNGCTGLSPNITIVEPPVLSLSFGSSVDANCSGSSDGSIAISTSGGTMTYSYEWSNGANTEDLLGVPAGTYTVTVTDINLCEATLPPITINEPTAIGISLDQASALACNGDTDGTVAVSLTGGQPPYSYAWSNGATTEDLSGLAAGSYTLSVTDNAGCLKTSIPYMVTEPDTLGIALATIVDVSCNGSSDGSIVITASGGTTGYSYLWSNGASTATITGLAPGDYTVEISDANGCSYNSAPFTVGEPALVGLSSSSIGNVSCNGTSDGNISVIASGGISPYSYTWSDGQTSDSASGLVAGDYSLVVTDNNGCSFTSMPILVTEPDLLEGNLDSIGDVSCNGGSDGAISISTSGGTPSYSYAWNNGATTENITGLAAGDYTLTISDANGCMHFSPAYTVNEAALLGLDLNAVNDVNCNGASDGTVSITASGGTMPYSYEWSNGATTANISGLAPNDYSLSLTDVNGCAFTAGPFSITEPSMLEIIQLSIIGVNCNGGSDGSISIMGSGGTPPYSYAWSNGSSLATATDLSAGNYTVTLTDDNGCSTNATYQVTEATQITLLELSTTTSCFGDPDGSAAVIAVSGGAAPYAYSLDGTNFQIDTFFTGLSAGGYELSIQDANGCVFGPTAFTIDGPASALNVVMTATPSTTSSSMDGSITANAMGGGTPYSYLWGNGATTETISGLAPGTYCVTVSDNFGCEVVGCADITVSAIPTIESLSSAKLFPNPTNDFAQLDLVFTEVVELELQLVNTLGQVLVQEQPGSTIQGSYTFDLRQMAAGIYFVRIRVDEQVVVKRLLKLE